MVKSNLNVCVIGGGPAGLASALNLSLKGFVVTVIEAENYDQFRAGEHLEAEAKLEFKRLGIPDEVWQPHSIPCTEIRNAWGRPGLHKSPSIFNPYGPELILSRPAFDRELAEFCVSLGVVLLTGFRVSRVLQKDEKWYIKGKEGDVQIADFIIDASGRNSKFHYLFEEKRKIYDRLIGITKHIQAGSIEEIESSYLLLEPIDVGWWYSIQLNDGTIIVTLMTDADIPQIIGCTQEELWQRALAKSVFTKERLENRRVSAKSVIQSARTQMLPKVYGTRCLAVGDAAMSFDPLSSAGIMKGFTLGKLAADTIEAYYSGNHEAFASYQQAIESKFSSYLDKWVDYYKQQPLWSDSRFWYRRNLKPAEISEFKITPDWVIDISSEVHPEELEYLMSSLPEIDVNLLFQCLKDTPRAGDAIRAYLKMKNQSVISQEIFQALESLRIIGILSRKSENIG